MSAAPDALDEQRSVLGRAAVLLSASLEFHETLRHTMGACLPALGDFGFVDVVQQESVVRVALAHDDAELERRLQASRWVQQEAQALNVCALSSGEPALHPHTDAEWRQRLAASGQALSWQPDLRFGSMLTVPLRHRGERVGALTLFMGRSKRCHTAAHLAMACELAALAAPVIVNARVLEQHRRAEEALRAGEERLRLAIEAGQLGIWDWDIEHDRVSGSERVYELYGADASGFGGKMQDFTRLAHPDDAAAVNEALQRALTGNEPYAVEFRVPLPDGGMRWLATRAHLVRDKSGRAVRMVGAATDVTERVALLGAERSARAAAEKARRRLELLAEAGAALSRSLDPHTTLEAIAAIVVPRIADWCRVDLLDANGELQRALTHHGDAQKAREGAELVQRLRAEPSTEGSMAWVVSTGRSYASHFHAPGATGKSPGDPAMTAFAHAIGLRASFVVPLVARGRTLGALAALQTESDRPFDEEDCALIAELAQRASLALDNARLYAEAEAALQQAETANRAKDEFLAMLGHELRNPLSPIVTALQLMKIRGDNTTAVEQAVIRRQVDHLVRLVDDLLDVSKITRGKVELRTESVEIAEVLTKAVEMASPLFEQRHHRLAIDVPAHGLRWEGDPIRLAQVVANLLTNAARYTEPGGEVQLAARREADTTVISVKDNGNGIPKEMLGSVFDLFVQGKRTVERSQGGLGIGLALVKSLVEMHGGTVAAHSQGPGTGSEFVIRLPLVAGGSGSGQEAKSEPSPFLAASHKRRILVVDDNVDAAELLGQVLNARGHEVRVVYDPAAALDVVEAFQPQVAVLDIGLPVMDGYELALQLRARLTVPPCRLLALTGYGQHNDRERSRSAGFEAHLVKPVDMRELFGLIERR